MLDKIKNLSKSNKWYVAAFGILLLCIPICWFLITYYLKSREIAALKSDRDILQEKLDHNKAIAKLTTVEDERIRIDSEIDSVSNEIAAIDSEIIKVGEQHKTFEQRLASATSWSDFQ